MKLMWNRTLLLALYVVETLGRLLRYLHSPVGVEVSTDEPKEEDSTR